MPQDLIRYDMLTKKAMLGVVKDVLNVVAKNGLPENHHFYISFNTQHPNSNLSKSILTKYPEQLTVVIQHQFWDLQIKENGFSVVLVFSGVPETLFIPWDAILGLYDPSVKFAIEFEMHYKNMKEQQSKKNNSSKNKIEKKSTANNQEQPTKIINLKDYKN